MDESKSTEDLLDRRAALAIDMEEFRAAGHALVDRITEFLGGLSQRLVTTGESPTALRAALGGGTLPESGSEPAALLDETATLLFDHSLFNGHPRFWGYITSSPAPIGMLGDLLAAAVNANVGAQQLAPIATEIEAQTVRWIAELMGYPTDCGGLLVSGGNMANMLGLWAARKARANWDFRAQGVLGSGGRRPRVYASRETHTWIHKAADLSGLGTDAVRFIPTDERLRLDVASLRAAIQEDLAHGDLPLLAVGTAGTISTGAVDPLPEIAGICREYGLWFHVDGAYGGLAASLLDAGSVAHVPDDLRGLREADSLAVDPHKWLYAPLEAGCTLVRNPAHLRDAFSFHPDYYHFDTADQPLNYLDYGPQNSRGFRALKVWLALRQAGRAGYVRMIADDIRLARALAERVAAEPNLQVLTNDLSITTLRYAPPELRSLPDAKSYLNDLNTALLERLQKGGEAFVSNAVLDDTFLLRACIVNFRTTLADVAELPRLVLRLGSELDAELRPTSLRSSGMPQLH